MFTDLYSDIRGKGDDMAKLIKYELIKIRKTALLMIAFATGLQLMMLIFYFLGQKGPMRFIYGVTIFISVMFMLVLGLSGVANFYRELKSKNSYMLYLTSRNSYQILGSKIISTLFCILLITGIMVIYLLLDTRVIIDDLEGFGRLEYRTIYELLKEILAEVFRTEVGAAQIVMIFTEMLIAWASTLCVGYLAVALCFTYLRNIKFNKIMCVGAFLVISYVEYLLCGLILPDQMLSLNYLLGSTALHIIVGTAAFLCAGMMLEKKADF